MKKVILAQSAGFCVGVKRSVDTAEKLLDEYGSCKCLGQIIHNEDVSNYLAQRGMATINSPEEALSGDNVIIRSHGVSSLVEEKLKEQGATVHDATCGNVKRIHKIVETDSAEGRFIIIVGVKGHPEVEGIFGRCHNRIIVQNLSELEEYCNLHPEIRQIPLSLVSQTTQLKKNFEECSNFIKKMCTNGKIYDTICAATSTRQKEAGDLAKLSDAMVVIGGKNSSNSIHLVEICKKSCENVLFVENAGQLDVSLLSDRDTVGVTAGASTPSWIIKEVINKMNDEIMNQGAIETSESVEPTFDQMLEETLKTIYNGDRVTGIVVSITNTEISVDLGTKYSGFIPTNEFTDMGIKVEDAVKVGDEIETIVVHVNDVEGTAQLSKKRLDAFKGWDEVEALSQSGEPTEGKVIETNKGGVVVNVKGVRVFVPAAQTDLPREADMNQLVGKNVKLKITEVNKGRKRVVGSIRSVARAEHRAKMEAFWNEIEVGKRYTGTVKSMTGYGAFVDIGGIDGMVHVSELSWGRVKQPSEVLSVGDEVEVYVISFDAEKRRISLGYKDPNANPWEMFKNTYAVGDTAEVKVVKLMPFGAFAEILPGVDGLIHISQLSANRVEKVEDAVAVGDVVAAKITKVDDEKHKVSLSVRQLLIPAPAAKEEEVVEEESGDDALVYEVSENGEASGMTVEE